MARAWSRFPSRSESSLFLASLMCGSGVSSTVCLLERAPCVETDSDESLWSACTFALSHVPISRSIPVPIIYCFRP
jgi:hypothetical protein